jgi:hypothetical protein
VWSVDNPFLVIIAVVTAVGLLATVLTRLWVHQISLRLEESCAASGASHRCRDDGGDRKSREMA